MASFTISVSDLTALKDRVLVITGGASGIGLATVELFHHFGAKVVVGDLNPIPESSKASGAVEFIRTDVTKWKDLLNLFSKAKSKYGAVDMVFANAGLLPNATYLDDTFDENGELEEPTWSVLDVSLRGCINTVRLAIHHMRSQEQGGSIVITASASSYQRFAGGDYSIAKHGVLGMVRALYYPLKDLPTKIRLNAVAPSWTDTGMVPRVVAAKAGFDDIVQPPLAVARSVALLMTDKTRHGELIYSEAEKYAEIELELLKAADAAMAVTGHTANDEEIRVKLTKAAAEMEADGS